ncbi:ABC-2 family transporter protein [Mariprofundus micogutta]|uniref:ABC-2 family transporter protein n=1 Tax=Mariprofundus micogutta TaxID=1921010 RepID=A0A1L8CQG9_9PROT|nr:ABC transporter permease subunit [Mariprofundus micogutta]GAV21176.1 ABC-2 family transporter protein [Mariprofundus micogutta]
MSKSLSLLLFSMKEISNQRIYQTLLAILIIIPWLLLIPTSLFMMDLGKVFMDMLFTFLHLWLLIYIFFLAAPLLARDIEMGTCNMFLTLPMSRAEYLWGRYAGVVATILPILLAYLISAVLAFEFAERTWPGYVLSGSGVQFTYGVLLILLPYLALTAVLFFIASTATGLSETTVFLFSVWLLCWSIPPVLGAMQEQNVAAKNPPWIESILQFINQLLPDISSSQISLHLAHHIPLENMAVIAYCIEHLAYSSLIMIVAVLLFQRRDLG